jgi:hypothetical protein
MARSIVGLFADRVAAERAIVDLKSAGFDPTQMGIQMRDRAAARKTTEDESGSVLLAAATPYRAQEAWEIMRRNGAEDLHETGFGEAPGQEVGLVYAQPPQDEVDGTVVPSANREDSDALEGNAVSSLTDQQHHDRPEPLPKHEEVDDQTAHQPPVRENDVVIGGWDTPNHHPTTDADILQEDTGHPGQPERPTQ